MSEGDLAQKLTQLTEQLTALTQARQGSDMISGGGTSTSSPDDIASTGAQGAPAIESAGETPIASTKRSAPITHAPSGIGLANLPLSSDMASKLAAATARARQEAGSGGSVTNAVLKSLGSAPSAAVTQRELSELEAMAASRTPAQAAAAKKYAGGAGNAYLDRQFSSLLKRLPTAEAAKAKRAMQEAISSAKSATDTAKNKFGRDRPFVQAPNRIKAIVSKPASKSFPSGHASGAYARAEVLAQLDPANASKYRDVAAQVGMSRAYGGVHFPSDIVAGSYVGTLAATRALTAAGIGAGSASQLAA